MKSINIKKVFSVFFCLFLILSPLSIYADALDDIRNADSADSAKEAIIALNGDDSLFFTKTGFTEPPNSSAPPALTLDSSPSLELTLTSYHNNPGGSTSYFFTTEENPYIFLETEVGGALDFAGWLGLEGDGPIQIRYGQPGSLSATPIFCSWSGGCGSGYDAGSINIDGTNTYDYFYDNKDDIVSILSLPDAGGIIENELKAPIQDSMGTILELMDDILTWIVNGIIGLVDGLLIIDINQGPVVTGWGTVRDASNLLLVVGLLLIAGFNLTRYQLEAYTAKALLPRLVLAGIFINFSFLLTTIIVEFGNVLTQYFSQGTEFTTILPQGGLGNLIASAALVSGGLAIYAFTGFILLSVVVGGAILLAILIFRIVLLYVLAIFSPLVFLFGVMPFTRGLTSQWWTYLMRYSFMGAVIALLLSVAATI